MQSRQTASSAKLVALGKAIRRARIAKGLSPEALATRCELRTEYLTRAERGQARLWILTLVTIAGALGVTVAQLFRAAKL